jgi:hypothetical protein
MAYGYTPGDLESSKFAKRKEPFYETMKTIKSLGYSDDDYIHSFAAFTGHMTISRYLALYESYKSVLGISGHIAEIGVFKGASLLYFAKLVEIFENQSFTQVHGFDWFKGNAPDKNESRIEKDGYAADYEQLLALIKAQQLESVVKVHKLDVTTELEQFFTTFPHLQFKLLFFDAGMYQVVKTALPYFWERLTPGGQLILDQFNFDVAPGETKAVKEILPNAKIRTYPFTWMPTAYIIKE